MGLFASICWLSEGYWCQGNWRLGSSAKILVMSHSSDNAPIGCIEDRGFFGVGQYGGGCEGSRIGRGSGRVCQLCYFVVFSP